MFETDYIDSQQELCEAEDKIIELSNKLLEKIEQLKQKDDAIERVRERFLKTDAMCAELREVQEQHNAIIKLLNNHNCTSTTKTGIPLKTLGRVSELLVRAEKAETERNETRRDYQEVIRDSDRLVRELDIIWNGEAGAAKQARLCDIVSQIKRDRIVQQSETARYKAVLEQISSGTADTLPPFRAAPASILIRIAAAALSGEVE